MFFFFAFLVVLYAIPFALVAAMPGWRSLAVAAVVLGGLSAWGIVEVNAEMDDPANNAGFGGAIVLLFFYSTLLGTISGAISRSVTLVLRRTRWARFSATQP